MWLAVSTAAGKIWKYPPYDTLREIVTLTAGGIAGNSNGGGNIDGGRAAMVTMWAGGNVGGVV